MVHIAITESLEIGPGVSPPGADLVGTGIVLDLRGYILTSNHLVENAETIIVTLHSGQSFFSELIGGDVQTDAAIIKVASEGLELQPATLGDRQELVVGQNILNRIRFRTHGDPIITNGIVSAIGVSAPASPN